MYESKKWFQSKIIWLGIIETIISLSELVSEFLSTGDTSAIALVGLVNGIAVIVARKWFTKKTVE